MNGDNRDDLIVADESCTLIFPPCPTSGGSISALIANADGTFQPPVQYAAHGYPVSVAVGDFNGDGKIDVVVANGNSPGTVSVFLGKGDGTFQSPVDYATAPNPMAVAVGDFNGDGKLDLAVAAAGSASVSILRGNGNGTFQAHVDYSVGQGPIAIVVADLNHDRKLDLAVSNDNDNTVSVLLGNGDGTFQNQKIYYPGHLSTTAMAVGDFNADGNLDLVVANSFDNTITFLLGKGDATFPTLLDYEYSPFGSSFGFTAADLTGDGALDLAIGNFGGGAGNSISFLLNSPVVGLFPTTLSFAKQVLGTGKTKSIGLRNPGSAPLRFADITVSGPDAADFVTADTCPQQIRPASGCAVSVTFSPKAEGTRSARITISDDAPGGSQVVSVGGVGALPAPTLSPTSVTYPDQVVGVSSAPERVNFTNVGKVSLTFSSIKITGTNSTDFMISSDSCGSSLGAGSTCTIAVIFTPKAIGTRTGAITFADDAINSPQQVGLTGMGTVVAFSPASLNFGSQTVGTTSAPKQVTVKNTGKTILTITSISITGTDSDDFHISSKTCPSTLAANTSCNVSVTFKPTATGKRSSSLAFADDGGGSPQKVSLTGTGE